MACFLTVTIHYLNQWCIIVNQILGNFILNEILIKIQNFSFQKMHLKMLSALWWPFCLDPNVFISDQDTIHPPITVVPCVMWCLRGDLDIFDIIQEAGVDAFLGNKVLYVGHRVGWRRYRGDDWKMKEPWSLAISNLKYKLQWNWKQIQIVSLKKYCLQNVSHFVQSQCVQASNKIVAFSKQRNG